MPKSPVTHDQFDAAMTAIKTDFDRVDERFKEVDQRFEQVDQRFEQIDRRFDQVDERFDRLEEKFDRRFEQVLTILATIDANMKELRTLPARVERLERAVFK